MRGGQLGGLCVGVTNVAGVCLLPGAQGRKAERVTLRRVGHPEPGDPGTLLPGQAGPRHRGNEPFRNPDMVSGPGLRVARAALQLRPRSQSVPVVMALSVPQRGDRAGGPLPLGGLCTLAMWRWRDLGDDPTPDVWVLPERSSGLGVQPPYSPVLSFRIHGHHPCRTLSAQLAGAVKFLLHFLKKYYYICEDV